MVQVWTRRNPSSVTTPHQTPPSHRRRVPACAPPASFASPLRRRRQNMHSSVLHPVAALAPHPNAPALLPICCTSQCATSARRGGQQLVTCACVRPATGIDITCASARWPWLTPSRRLFSCLCTERFHHSAILPSYSLHRPRCPSTTDLCRYRGHCRTSSPSNALFQPHSVPRPPTAIQLDVCTADAFLSPTRNARHPSCRRAVPQIRNLRRY